MNKREPKSTYLREERDRALFEAYTKALRNIRFNTQEEAINYVRTHEAPKFYISGEFAAYVIGRMLRGVSMGVTGIQRIKKFKELFRRFCEVKNTPRMKGLSNKDICSLLVDEPAPEFYINYRMAKGILLEQRKLVWEKEYRRR